MNEKTQASGESSAKRNPTQQKPDGLDDTNRVASQPVTSTAIRSALRKVATTPPNIAEFDPDNIPADIDAAPAVNDWSEAKLPLTALPLCMSGDDWPLTAGDFARLAALLFVRHRGAFQERLAVLAAGGIQPSAGKLAEALALGEAIARRELLHREKSSPLENTFTLPLPGVAGQYRWDMGNACIALAFVLWDVRGFIGDGVEFQKLSPADRAELAEAVMLAELVLYASGNVPDGDSEAPEPGKATTAQRIAWHILTTVVGLRAVG